MSRTSSPVAEALQRGLRHHQAGQLQEAEALYREILDVNPTQAEALHLLGMIALQTGRAESAVAYLSQAAQLQPRAAEHHNRRGDALKALGRLTDAEAAYREAVRLRGRFPEALLGLGTTLLMLGRFGEAESYGRKLVRIKPEAWEAHTLLGHGLGGLGRYDEAETCHRAAVRLNPGASDAHNNLGYVLTRLGRAGEAEGCYREAVRLNPNSVDARNNLGCCLRDLNRPAEAEPHFVEALRLRPDFVEAHINWADTLYLLGRAAEAERHAREAARLRPGSPQAHNSLGCALRDLGRIADAAAAFREALRLKPDFAEAANNLGSALTNLGDWDEAESCFRTTLSLHPGSLEAQSNLAGVMLAQGRYADIIPQYERVLAQDRHFAPAWHGLLHSIPYIPELDRNKAFAVHRAFGQACAEIATQKPLINNRDPERRLRVGWLSSDFRNHPIAANIEPIFIHRNRAAFEAVCYADVKAPDAMTDRVRGMADIWRSVPALDDATLAELIRGDRVDIMIYLAGRFDHNRPQVAAWRPAPVQISFHDVATTGIGAVDYLIADTVLVPTGGPELFVERVLRLPNFYVRMPPADDPAPADPPCLSGSGVTFGCFHNPIKLNSAALALWGEVLRRLPDARLRFKYQERFASAPLRDEICRRVGSAFADRIQFDRTRTAFGDHLRAYNGIDIALDPFPFNGSTSTFEALWMGVPIVTLAGDRMVSRWSASLLRKVGLDDLIASSPEDYVARVTRLAADKPRLMALRQGLRERLRHSSLCDGARTTRYFERALRAVWRTWCHEAPAAPGPDA